MSAEIDDEAVADKAFVVANLVRLLKTHGDGPFVLVEGGFDARMYSRYLNGDAEVLVCEGKEIAVMALAILRSAGVDKVIALLDADFDRIESPLKDDVDIVLTDNHDLECMILRSPAWDKVMALHHHPKRIQYEAKQGSVQATVLRAGRYLGALRLVSSRGLGLDFNGLTMSRFVNRATFDVDVQEMIRQVANNSNRHDLDAGQTSIAVTRELAQNHDPWELCCGHDLIALLCQRPAGSPCGRTADLPLRGHVISMSAVS